MTSYPSQSAVSRAPETGRIVGDRVASSPAEGAVALMRLGGETPVASCSSRRVRTPGHLDSPGQGVAPLWTRRFRGRPAGPLPVRRPGAHDVSCVPPPPAPAELLGR